MSCHIIYVSQVEERLRFYEEGVAPRKNLDVMHEVMGSLKAADGGAAAAEAADAGGRQRVVVAVVAGGVFHASGLCCWWWCWWLGGWVRGCASC